MSRNRARNSHSLQWAGVLQWVAVLLLISIFGASYVILKNKVLRLASEVNNEERELNGWERRNQQMKCDIARVTSYGELQRRLTALNSGMVRIGELEIIPMEGSGMRPSVSSSAPATAIARGPISLGATP